MTDSADSNDASGLTRQLFLDLQRRTHGGVRPGAGRPRKKDSERGFVAHRARASHRKGDPVHVTLRVKGGVPSLRREPLSEVVTAALLAQRHELAKRQGFQVVHFSIQDDHLHLIVEAPDKREIARGVAGLEIRIARQLNKLLGRKGALWSERYHRRALRTPTEVRNAIRYVLLNFQKHHRIIGEGAFADPYSSAVTFDGFLSMPVVFIDSSPWPKVTARTWLLATGWRQRGLLDPADVPRRSPSFRRR